MHDLDSLSWTSIASSHNFRVYAIIFTVDNFKFILHKNKIKNYPAFLVPNVQKTQ